jgi:hypothetical protein
MILDVSGKRISVVPQQFNGPVTININPGRFMKMFD